MNRRVILQQIVGAAFLLAWVAGLVTANPPKTGSSTASKIHWQSNLKSAQKLSYKQGKPILIVFGATWCGPCKKLEKETFGDPQTAEMIEQQFIPVHLDYDHEPRIVKILEIERVPCTVILTPDADLLHRSEGYANPKEFQAKLTAALEKRDEIQQTRGTAGR